MRYRLAWLSLCSLLACGDDDGIGRPDGALLCTDDAECGDGIFCNGAELCMPSDPSSDILGCVSRPPPCIDGRTCDELSSTCATDCGEIVDADGDGHDAVECGGDDCNDGDRGTFPGNSEVCDVDGHDEDCDLRTYGFRDADGDGSPDATCCNISADGDRTCGDDCDDMRPATSPLATEICDMVDNDCDGTVDEGTAADAWFIDADGDGFGNALDSMLSCGELDGRVPRAGDCDDTDSAVNPDAAELCDGIDNDCNGALDAPGEDEDEDGFASLTCGGDDCDDTEAEVFPGARETCNRRDDDCSSGGGVDTTEDADDDGFASLSATCEAGELPKLDCDDLEPLVFFGAPELCNRRDDDCSSGGGLDTTEDADEDGHAPTTSACSGGFPNDDCDDTSAARYAGNAELCDGLDNDCDPGTALDSGCAGSIIVESGSSTALAGPNTGIYFCEDPSFAPCGPGCPTGSGLIGFQVRDNGFMSQVIGLCRGMDVSLRAATEDVYDVTWGASSTITAHGQAAGAGGTTQCITDEWVIGIHGLEGATIGRLGVVCGSIAITGNRAAGYDTRTTFTRDALPRGGPGGTAFRLTCGSDTIIGGYEGFTNPELRSLAPFCGRPTVLVR